MLGNVAYYADYTLALDNLAFVANLFNRSSDFHISPLHTQLYACQNYRSLISYRNGMFKMSG